MGPRDEDLAVLVSVTKTGVEPCWLVHYIVIAVSYAAWIMKKNKKKACIQFCNNSLYRKAIILVYIEISFL